MHDQCNECPLDASGACDVCPQSSARLLRDLREREAGRRARDRRVSETLERAQEAEGRGQMRLAAHLRADAEGWRALDI
jgi:hypothetical protein